MRRTFARVLLAGMLVVFGASVIGFAQSVSSASGDILPSLLAEVRGLRAAMEHMASAAPRVQLTLGRLELQEQRIANQVRRLDTVKASLLQAQRALEPLADGIKNLAAHDEPVDTDSRRAREFEMMETKKEWARVSADVQRLSGEAALLEQDIAAEQNRWSEFNQRLEELDRALGRR